MDDSDVRPHGKEADKPDRLSWSDDDEVNRRDRAYHEREPQESEQRNREEIQIVDLQ